MDEHAASDEKAGLARCRRLAESRETEHVDRETLESTMETVFSTTEDSSVENDEGSNHESSPFEHAPGS